MADASYLSNDSSECDLNAETLDQLYKDQLQNLRDLMLKQNQTNDIELCRKWLKVFSKTAEGEKMARNCLCSLMQQQLQESGFLGPPFTDMQNCNRDLEQVLRELDAPSSIEESEAHDTFSSHRRLHPTGREFPTQRSELITELTCLENESQAENVILRRELESLRLQLTASQIDNVKLKEMTEQFHLDNTTCVETLENIKQLISRSIQTSLQEMEADQQFPLHVFELVLRDFVADAAFLRTIKKYDTHFQKLLNKLFQKELNERKSLIARHVSRNFGKTKSKLLRRYERRLKVQTWAQKLQLKLVKLKCFSALRQLFINADHGGDAGMWEMLKALEEKYQTIVDEII